MPAKHSFRSMELRGSCLSCASGLLAAKVSRGAGLRASDGVRMVRWGFRALKTPEERLHCRRFSVGSLTPHFDCIHAANLLHFCCTNAATEVDRLHKCCRNTALRLHSGMQSKCSI